ncbi:uncharacterized protein LOC110986414 [Acanthaster planci]|uniref:Uncharacterized protein LOC110986414 n=1 Tax=Acanthaster planci TaxID=133434 RepID=A0A8B7ZKW9_ACAPL|nr:uncharacterized protein LOC110986414 [Acanthaster planci]
MPRPRRLVRDCLQRCLQTGYPFQFEQEFLDFPKWLMGDTVLLGCLQKGYPLHYEQEFLDFKNELQECLAQQSTLIMRPSTEVWEPDEVLKDETRWTFGHLTDFQNETNKVK